MYIILLLCAAQRFRTHTVTLVGGQIFCERSFPFRNLSDNPIIRLIPMEISPRLVRDLWNGGSDGGHTLGFFLDDTHSFSNFAPASHCSAAVYRPCLFSALWVWTLSSPFYEFAEHTSVTPAVAESSNNPLMELALDFFSPTKPGLLQTVFECDTLSAVFICVSNEVVFEISCI